MSLDAGKVPKQNVREWGSGITMVQNQWYTVFDLRNVFLQMLEIWDSGEPAATKEKKFTYDGEVLTKTDSESFRGIKRGIGEDSTVLVDAVNVDEYVDTFFRRFKFEMRQTDMENASPIGAIVKYSQLNGFSSLDDRIAPLQRNNLWSGIDMVRNQWYTVISIKNVFVQFLRIIDPSLANKEFIVSFDGRTYTWGDGGTTSLKRGTNQNIDLLVGGDDDTPIDTFFNEFKFEARQTSQPAGTNQVSVRTKYQQH